MPAVRGYCYAIGALPQQPPRERAGMFVVAQGLAAAAIYLTALTALSPATGRDLLGALGRARRRGRPASTVTPEPLP